MTILRIIFELLIITFFLWLRLAPYQDRLFARYRRPFRFFDAVFSPLLRWLRQWFKPVVVGQGLSIDSAQFFVFALLLALAIIF